MFEKVFSVRIFSFVALAALAITGFTHSDQVAQQPISEDIVLSAPEENSGTVVVLPGNEQLIQQAIDGYSITPRVVAPIKMPTHLGP